MKIKPLHVVMAIGLLSLGTGAGMKSGKFLEDRLAALQTAGGTPQQQAASRAYMPFNTDTLSGNYLAAHFAQTQYDWGAATQFLDKVLASGNPDTQLIRRAMVIAMGSGDAPRAFALSKTLLQAEPENALGLMFASIEALQKQDFAAAKAAIDKIPASDNVDFIVPVVRGWIEAAAGTLDTEKLKDGSIHLFHSIYIADFLKRPDIIEYNAATALQIKNITAQDIDRIADFYVHVGKPDIALPLYEKILLIAPDSETIKSKIAAIKNGTPQDNFKGVNNPVDGVAVALEEMSQTLFQEYSDDSARVFAQLAIYLKPDITLGRMLLAEIAARHDRLDDAIAFYQAVPTTSPQYIQAHRRAAELLEDAGRTDEALQEIEAIITAHNDVEAMMQAGDIYRRQENFKKALSYYDRAAAAFDEKIPPQYWTLHYVRGMAYERLNQWPKAEHDLKAALAFQPENPMVLNYLGYAWADQGVNLDQSLDMIRKAVALSPGDGYITDSLGWVLYRKGNYKEAVPHLERAVELLPYDPTINDHLGDAYWQVGRKLEARFQWERAKNNAEEADLIKKIDEKLANGLPAPDDITKQAHSHTDTKIDLQRP